MKPNILVVDDVKSNLIVLTNMIQDAGYIARPVTSVLQAQEAIKECIPDLILLDIAMPEMNGFEFCERLKKYVKTKHIPIIFISGLNSTQDKIKAFRLGAVDYICKPFEAEEVTLRINTHLKMHQMQEDVEKYNQRLQMLLEEQSQYLQQEQIRFIKATTRMIAGDKNLSEQYLKHIGVNSKVLAIAVQITESDAENVSNEFIEHIEIASYAHLMGVILTAKEFEQSYMSPFFKLAIEIAKYTGEKFDGSNSSRGLIKQQIPLAARIVALVRQYELLKEQKIEQMECFEQLNAKAGTCFDPNLTILLYKIRNHLI